MTIGGVSLFTMDCHPWLVKMSFTVCVISLNQETNLLQASMNLSLLKKIFLNFFKAAADEKIKEQLTGSAAGTGSKTHQEQLQFSNAIKDIESSSFIQSSFVSNRYVRGFASIFSPKKKWVCFYKDCHLEPTLLKHLSLQIFFHCEPVLTHL